MAQRGRTAGEERLPSPIGALPHNSSSQVASATVHRQTNEKETHTQPSSHQPTSRSTEVLMPPSTPEQAPPGYGGGDSQLASSPPLSPTPGGTGQRFATNLMLQKLSGWCWCAHELKEGCVCVAPSSYRTVIALPCQMP